MDAPISKDHWSEQAGTWVFVAFLVVFGATMAPRVSNIAGGADPSSYLELSRLFLRGDFNPPLRPVAGLPLETFPPWLYPPISYLPRADCSGLVPTAFTGLPLLYSFFDLFLPTPWAISLVVWLTMMGCGGFTFLLLRAMGFGSAWACFGGVSMGISPLTVLIGSIPLTDPLTCCLAALSWFLALQANRGPGWGMALGFALGLAVLTRVTNGLFFPAVLIALLSRGWRNIPWTAIGIGGLPAAVFMFAYNLHVHGHALTTVGYANAADLFNLKQFIPSLLHYARMLPVLLLPVIVATAPFSLLLARRSPSAVAASWAWIVAFTGFYAFYYASSESWFILRYIMPAMVALTAAAILVLSHLERWLVGRVGKPRWAGGFPLALAVAAILYGAWQGNRLHAYDFKRNESNILEVVDWIERSTSADDVFLCFQFSGSLHYYTDRALLRHDQLTAESWQKLSKATRDGPDVFGVFYVFEFSDGAVIGSRFDGDWEETFKTRDSVIRVFRLNRPKAPAPG